MAEVGTTIKIVLQYVWITLELRIYQPVVANNVASVDEKNSKSPR
jgi:hypothetical protein